MASDKLQYLFTDRASLDLDEIANYISVELSNPQAASVFIEHLLKM